MKIMTQHKWVPGTTAWRILRLRREERPPIWRVATDILNKQGGQPTRSGPPVWGLGEVLTTPQRINVASYETVKEYAAVRAIVSAVMNLRVT